MARPKLDLKGKGKKEARFPTPPPFLLCSTKLGRGYNRLYPWIENLIESEVEYIRSQQDPLNRMPQRVKGKLYLPKTKGVFLVTVTHKGMSSTLLFEIRTLYYMGFNTGKVWYHFNDFDPSELPLQSEFPYDSVVELDISSSYANVGGFDITVCKKDYEKMVKRLSKVAEYLAKGLIEKLKAGPLSFPVVTISEAMRFWLLRKWTLGTIAFMWPVRVPGRFTKYLRSWSTYSTAYAEGRPVEDVVIADAVIAVANDLVSPSTSESITKEMLSVERLDEMLGVLNNGCIEPIKTSWSAPYPSKAVLQTRSQGSTIKGSSIDGNVDLAVPSSSVPPTELDQGLLSAQDSVLVKDHIHPAADNKQTYANDWSLPNEPLSGNKSSLPATSGDPSLYQAALHPSTHVADVVCSHEKSYSDENISAAVKSVDASERHFDHHVGNSEYNDGLLQNSSTYLPQNHSHIEDQVEESNADISAAANFQDLSLHDEELAATKFAEFNPAVIIPDHLQVANAGCAGLRFGSFEFSPFSGASPQKSTDNNSDFPAVEQSEAVDHTDTRDKDYDEVPTVNSLANENLEDIMGANTGNLDVPSIPQPDVLRQEILYDPSGVQYNLPSVSSPAQPNAMEAMQTRPSLTQQLVHPYSQPTLPIGYPYLAQNYPAYLPSTAFQQAYASNGQFHQSEAAVPGAGMKYSMPHLPPRQHLDFGLSPLLAAQPMGTRYNLAVPTTTGQAISMQEPLESGVLLNTQSTPNLLSTSIPRGPHFPQQFVHPYSQPTLPIAPSTDMIGYPYLVQNYPAYLPSTAFQQAYSSNGQFHQFAAAVPGAGMKYSMPQYKNSMSDTNLQQQQEQPSSVISGYGGFGSSSNLPVNFALNHNATPAAMNSFDEVMSGQYKAPNEYMAALHQQQQQQQQQGYNSAMWHHGAVSRTTSALPPTQFYANQGEIHQQGGFRQAQQQPSRFGGHGYPAFYHSQGGITQEHHPQNPAEGSLNGYQVAPSQQSSQQSWQHQTKY